ncbi:MAG: hypothetical protein ACN6OB_17515 [Chryseobacterium jejuense]|uniref:hypothetical protein n=1 Tax=Chryseobacterium jejuense TaxID=445960 RepID=UPI003D0A6E2A
MKTKYFTLIFIFFTFYIFGQLKLGIELIGADAYIKISNNSKEDYVLPIDKYHFRPYELECDAFFDYEDEFPAFGLMVNVLSPDGNKEDYVVGYNRKPKFDSLVRVMDLKRNNLKEKILDWSKKNNIKDHNLAFINYNIINNLVYLKSGEELIFKIKLDLNNITNQELIFYNYILEHSKKYKLYLTLCNFKEINKYLTSAQKSRLKDYNFFTNKLDSNIVELKFHSN